MEVRITIYGYEAELHEKTYPLIEDIFVFEKNKIVKVDLKLSKQVSCIFDDIGYDDDNDADDCGDKDTPTI